MLRDLVLHPDREFSVRGHVERYGVVRATATADFRHLVERGLMAQGNRGAANAYYAAPRMREVLLGA